ncbi:MAG: hypothetical protein COA45_10850 [Zetaproteobacteria bacterium]|nr:MAG: hypothetical protein COA45_10850 [Zetaproteobacteria bacterium]
MLKDSDQGSMKSWQGAMHSADSPSPDYQTSCPLPVHLPDSWEFIDYAPADIHTGLVRAHAHGEPRSKITFISGFKANAIDYNTPQLRALQRVGIEIDIIILPDPGKGLGYLEDNKRIVAAVLKDDPPPSGLKPGIPNHIFGHSLGGRAFVANMLDKDFAQNILKNYAGSVLIAPHFSSPYRSKPVLNAVYSTYCRLFSEKAYGDAPLDWTLSAMESLKQNFRKAINKGSTKREIYEERTKAVGSIPEAETTATTHGQILYSNIQGERLRQRIMDDGVPDAAKAFPMIMIGGSKDFVSCKNYIESVAKEFSAVFYEFDTYHNPFLESRDARTLILDAMRDMSNHWRNINIRGENTIIHTQTNGHCAQITGSAFEDPMAI